jgi:uncharacterized protein YjbJ (UPF0337 family)
MWGHRETPQRHFPAWQPGLADTRYPDHRWIHCNATKEDEMNWDRVEGNWKQFTGKVKEKWGKLTEDDLTMINGKQEQLVGRIQERYGVAKDDAQKQVNSWVGGL